MKACKGEGGKRREPNKTPPGKELAEKTAPGAPTTPPPTPTRPTAQPPQGTIPRRNSEEEEATSVPSTHVVQVAAAPVHNETGGVGCWERAAANCLGAGTGPAQEKEPDGGPPQGQAAGRASGSATRGRRGRARDAPGHSTALVGAPDLRDQPKIKFGLTTPRGLPSPRARKPPRLVEACREAPELPGHRTTGTGEEAHREKIMARSPRTSTWESRPPGPACQAQPRPLAVILISSIRTGFRRALRRHALEQRATHTDHEI